MCSQADYAHLGADLDIEQAQQDGAQGEPQAAAWPGSQRKLNAFQPPYYDLNCTFPSRAPDCGRRAVAVYVTADGGRMPRCHIHDGPSARYAADAMGATRVSAR